MKLKAKFLINIFFWVCGYLAHQFTHQFYQNFDYN